jgi:glycosyltransferase involved in cell wall biosynthesis
MNGIDKEHFSNHLTCLIEKGSHADPFETNGYPIFVLNAQRGQTPLKLLHNWRETRKLSRLLNEHKIDIVHTHDFFSAFLVRLATPRTKVKKVYVTLHNLQTWLNPIHHLINYWQSRHTTTIICVSEAVHKFSKLHDRLPESKYKVIRNGVDVNHFKPNDFCRRLHREEFCFSPDDIVVGTIGRLSYQKGQKFLVEAVGQLLPQFPNLKLVIVGSERADELHIKKELLSLSQQYNMTNSLIFTGGRRDTASLLNAFDVYCMPSITEGLSYASLEAMATQKTVIYSDIAPFAEIVRDKDTGLLFRSTDVSDLKEKLRFAITNPVISQSMAKRARNYVVQNHDEQRVVEQYEKLYLS